jgi:hypothetical protein
MPRLLSTHVPGLGIKSPYGIAFGFIEAHLKLIGWEVESLFTVDEITAIAKKGNKGRLEEILKRADEFDPDLVFHREIDFSYMLGLLNPNIPQRNKTKYEISFALYSRFHGRIEHAISSGEIGWDDEINTKDALLKVALKQGWPIPNSRVLNEETIDLSSLAQELTGSKKGKIILKNPTQSGGINIFPITSEEDLEEALISIKNPRGYLAQELIKPPKEIPYSIRIVSFGSEIIGAEIIFNPTKKYLSNACQGGFGITLGLPGQPLSENGLLTIPTDHRTQVIETLEHCGIDYKDRILPNRLLEVASKVASFPANQLLRGSDYICPNQEPILLEVNAGPGGPGQGMWASITETPKWNMGTEIGIAANLISLAIENLYQ